MPRIARPVSEIDTYLVVLKTQNIVIDTYGRDWMLECVKHYVHKMNGALYAYHFDDMSFRFVLRSDQMSELVKSVCIRFAYAYNKHANRRGEIFKDRFVSFGAHTQEEIVEMIACLHYLQPKTTYCSNQEYNDNPYLKDKLGKPYLVMTKDFENQLYEKAQSVEVLELMRKVGKKYTEEEMKQYLDTALCQEKEVVDQEKKKTLIEKLSSFYGASIRQIVKLTGFPFRFVYQALKKELLHEKTK